MGGASSKSPDFAAEEKIRTDDLLEKIYSELVISEEKARADDLWGKIHSELVTSVKLSTSEQLRRIGNSDFDLL